ncbi:hypothetical protein [Ancylobacter pratisalsi]|uniref:Uncharacterized protein n=1 Tax=Ancylobacter pratisalsi TaxID=1745854 RepID=A0A6P1YPD6_9HYPH|nr:hypothetical protein [Ancylobacter pratisalsi]QIB33604.1 hypothetical protein G3A50_07745 [Ancylobacter pratisalsi]
MTDSSDPQAPSPQMQERPLDTPAPEPTAPDSAIAEPTPTEKAAPERSVPERPAPAHARQAHASSRTKGPPQDPEAFHRWIEIERLKVEMRRLELDSRRLDAPIPTKEPQRRTSSHLTIATTAAFALTLLLLIAALIQIALLRSEIGALRGAQAAVEQRLDDRLAALLEARLAEMKPTSPAPMVAASTAPALPQAASPVTEAASGAGGVAPAEQQTPAEEAAPAVPEPPAKPAKLGTGYVVRMFAPTGAVPAARVEAFTNILKGAGFEVVVSDSGVVQPTANTLAYHAEAAGVAEKLATLVQSKRPALDLELRTSPSIPENAKQVLILNVTEGALN